MRYKRDVYKRQVWESKDGPDEFIRKAGDSFHKLYPNITIEYVNVEIPLSLIHI